ncbi:MAG: protein kinase [Candidatus Eisenbacteria bacterium]|uniref:Protein kinase n=1 Tax=Eiseniibacteriota bacterium TaxID=2212470 RepID=A0A956NCL5_UNCEI|nr:protein kinase [Candidatus Eisenbacteria bacterium]MCB9465857.1 protein kinase [Candidatus Eisenbacteria bacterium]
MIETSGAPSPEILAEVERELVSLLAQRPYSELELVGTGGMGWVFRAHHATLGLHAIKVVRRGIQDAHAALARFEQEARLLHQEIHSNVPRVYDHVVVSNPNSAILSYLVMDFVSGSTLHEWSGQHRSLEEKIDIAIQIVDALRAVHDRGILHRDVKDTNVLVDGEGRAWLCDFGVALDSRSAERVTQVGGYVGTRRYAAPELLTGKGVASEASEIYSLGAVLWEVVHECTFLPAALSRTDLVSSEVVSYPPLLDELVRRMMAADPALRPSLDTIRGELTMIGGGDAAPSYRPRPTMPEVPKPQSLGSSRTRVSRARWPFVSAAAAAVVLVAWLAFGRGGDAPLAESSSSMPSGEAVTDADRAHDEAESPEGPSLIVPPASEESSLDRESASRPREDGASQGSPSRTLVGDASPSSSSNGTRREGQRVSGGRESQLDLTADANAKPKFAPYTFRVRFEDPNDPTNSPEPNIRILVDGRNVWSGPWSPTVSVSAPLGAEYRLIPNSPFWSFDPEVCTGELGETLAIDACTFEVTRL